MRTKRPSQVTRISAAAAIGALAVTGLTTMPAYAEESGNNEDIEVTIQADPDWSPQDSYRVDDVLQFQLVVKNTASGNRAVSVTDSNLDNYKPCKWWKIGGQNDPGDSVREDCRSSRGFITHKVTAEDIEKGSFTPWVQVRTNEVNNPAKVYIEAKRVEGPAFDVPSGAFWIESLEVEGGAADSYKEGDTVEYTVRLGGANDQHSYAVTASSFDEGTAACSVGATSDTRTCGPLTHTFTSQDANDQSWAPIVTVTASADGAVVRSEDMVGDSLSVIGVFPPAEKGTAVDADASLAGDMSDPMELIHREGTDLYRIPAITAATNGDLLASFDERPTVDSCASQWRGGDSPNPNSIVQRRSKDGGKTWGPKTYIHRGTPSVDCDKQEGYSDPSYIVDYETGTIFNFHVKSFKVGLPNASSTGNDPQDRDVIQAEVSTSHDNGYTWTHEVITPIVNPLGEDTWRFAASGQGIQTLRGPHAGRLIQQFTVKNARGNQAVSVYSDDHGKTWKRGAPIGSRMDENKVVELSDGTLMLNSRDWRYSGRRITAISHDAGETWTQEQIDPTLVDSRNNGQLIRAFPTATADDPRSKVLLFSNAQGSQHKWNDRTNGTIWMSCDDGKTWPYKRVFREQNTSYSTIAVQPDGRIGLLSEDNAHSAGIFYRSFPIGWVGGVCQTMTSEPVTAEAGTKRIDLTVTIDNYVAPGAQGGTLSINDLPDGWTAAPVQVGSVAEGVATGTISLTIPKGAKADEYPLTAVLTDEQGANLGSTTTSLTLTEPVKPDYVARAAGQKNTKILWGDWNGDGHATYAVRSFTRLVVFDVNAEDAKPASTIQIGRVSDAVHVGDWNGDSKETLALVRGTTALLQDSIESAKTTSITVPKGDLKVVHQDGKDILVPVK